MGEQSELSTTEWGSTPSILQCMWLLAEVPIRYRQNVLLCACSLATVVWQQRWASRGVLVPLSPAHAVQPAMISTSSRPIGRCIFDLHKHAGCAGRNSAICGCVMCIRLTMGGSSDKCRMARERDPAN